jgi:hypothetical protein
VAEQHGLTRWCRKHAGLLLVLIPVAFAANTILVWLSYVHHDDEIRAAGFATGAVLFAATIGGMLGLMGKAAMENRAHTAAMHTLAKQHADQLAREAALAAERLHATARVHAAEMDTLRLAMACACDALGRPDVAQALASGNSVPPPQGRPRLRDVNRDR